MNPINPRDKQKMVKVYSPDGVEETHTVPNARDLINLGYTYQKGIPITPAAALPRALRPAAPPRTEMAQDVIDLAGAPVRGAAKQPEVEDEIGADADEALAEAAEVLAEVPAAVVEPTPTGRRGRGK